MTCAYWIEAVALSGERTKFCPCSAPKMVPNALTLVQFEGTPDARSPLLALSAAAVLAVSLLAALRRQLARL